MVRRSAWRRECFPQDRRRHPGQEQSMSNDELAALAKRAEEANEISMLVMGRIERVHDLPGIVAEVLRERMEGQRLVIDLREKLALVMKTVQAHQPAGSPAPGDEQCLVAWVLATYR